MAGSVYVAALSLARTKILPSGSVNVGVRGIGLPMATTLKVRCFRPVGHSPSARFAQGSVALAAIWAALAPSHGAPLCPAAVNGGRVPMFGRNIGYAGRPLIGLIGWAGADKAGCAFGFITAEITLNFGAKAIAEAPAEAEHASKAGVERKCARRVHAKGTELHAGTALNRK